MSARKNAKQFVLGKSGNENANSLQSFGFEISDTGKLANDNQPKLKSSDSPTQMHDIKRRPGESAVAAVPRSQNTDQRQFFAQEMKPANDNSEQKEKKQNQLQNEGNQLDKNFVSNGVSSSQRGGTPVKNDPSAIDGPALQNIGKNSAAAALVSDPNFLKQKAANDNEQVREKSGINPNDFFEVANENREFSESELEDQTGTQLLSSQEDIEAARHQDILENVRAEMKKHGINISLQDAEVLLTSNFKTKFPTAMLAVSTAKWIQEIVFSGTGIAISVVGFSPQILNAIPIIGSVVAFFAEIFIGAPIVIVGLVITILSITLNVLYKIIYFVWSYYYSQNAIDFSKRIGVIKKMFIRYIIRRLWLVFFAFIPLVSGLLDMIFVVVLYFYMARICQKAKMAVAKAQG